MTKNTKPSTARLALLALLTALVSILAYFGGFIKIGGLASISLTLIPVVLGAALCGAGAGAWLGVIAGVVFFATPDAAFWFGMSVGGTVVTVLVKGALSGLLAGLAYSAIEKYNRYIAVIVAAIVCPIVNTGIFIIGCFIFFMDAVSAGATSQGMPIGMYILIFYVGLNFVFEMLSNIILSPTVVKLISIKKNGEKKAS